MLINISQESSKVAINDPYEEREEVVEVEETVAKKKEGDEDADEEVEEVPEDLDEGEEKKAKFDPLQFQWTVSNGTPKSLPQVFSKIKVHRKVRLTPILTPSYWCLGTDPGQYE